MNGGVLSPDGRFIAYTSNETEAFELYVRPFDAAKGAAVGRRQVRVSKDGAGGLMVWRATAASCTSWTPSPISR